MVKYAIKTVIYKSWDWVRPPPHPWAKFPTFTENLFCKLPWEGFSDLDDFDYLDGDKLSIQKVKTEEKMIGGKNGNAQENEGFEMNPN